ncbi:ABC transporter substrate-binding protein [Orrella marina]|uniref:Branched-chain amino acid ABC transporter substrate-binding protein n=1 Tax=Orrella marina TaxID=2163011 RepID=A0A2R4XN73_9BURK|nr:ABC transporter substrate-binding protein [Orrella marina]AWB35243.1 branched-chain amino acid ABC transporter substrate-binding protein [Orrella marina]
MKKVLGVLALCQALVAAPALAQDIKLGAAFPMSGANAEYGEIFSSGVNLGVEHVNADKRLKGTMAVVYEDSQALPTQGVIAANKLINVEETPYILSAFTGVSKALAPLGQRNQVVMINGGGVGPDLAQLGPYFWNVIPLANLEVETMVPFLVNEKGLKRVALVYVDDPLGQAAREVLDKELKAAGGELVGAFSIPATAQQFSGVAARVRDTRPDAVYIASYGNQQVQLVKQLRDNGVSQPLASYSAFSIPSLLNLPEAKGSYFTSQQINLDSPDERTKRMVADYRQKFNKDPNMYAINYYNAVLLYADLVEALQKEGKAITGANLLEQRQKTPTFDFVGSPVSFLEDGTVKSPVQINEIAGDGSFTLLKAGK